MRVFKKYAPLQIAKHISAFYKGTFYIQGQGEFLFDCGKVILDKEEKDSMRVRICHEINKAISSMSAHLRAN